MNARNVTSIVTDALVRAGYDKSAVMTLKVAKDGNIVIKVPYTVEELDILGADRLCRMFGYLRHSYPDYHPDFCTTIDSAPKKPAIDCDLFRLGGIENTSSEGSATARCHPNDEFSYLYGQGLTLARVIYKRFKEPYFLREFAKDWA